MQPAKTAFTRLTTPTLNALTKWVPPVTALTKWIPPVSQVKVSPPMHTERVFMTPPSDESPTGHVRYARRSQDGSVFHTEGGFISDTGKPSAAKHLSAIALSHKTSLYPVPTETRQVNHSPGSKADKAWQASGHEVILERKIFGEIPKPQSGVVKHERYSPTTDCVAAVLQRVNIADQNFGSTWPWGTPRVPATVAALRNHGFTDLVKHERE